MKVLWRGISKEDGELQLKNFIKEADPDAVLRQDEDGTWIIEGDAVLTSIMIVKRKD